MTKLSVRPVVHRMDVQHRVRKLEPCLRALGGRRLALFGSFVRGEQDLESDVDVLVDFTPGAKTFDSFMDLAELLEGSLGRRVELITFESLSPFLGPRILAEAVEIFPVR